MPSAYCCYMMSFFFTYNNKLEYKHFFFSFLSSHIYKTIDLIIVVLWYIVKHINGNLCYKFQSPQRPQNCSFVKIAGGSGKLQLNIKVTWKHLSTYCLHMSRAYFKTLSLSAHPCQHIETNFPFVHCLRPADVSRNWSVIYVGTYFPCQLSGNLSQLCELLVWLFVLWCFHCLSPLQADKIYIFIYIYMCKNSQRQKAKFQKTRHAIIRL